MNYLIYIFVLLHVTVILQNSLGLIFSMISLTPNRWIHLHGVFRAVCFFVVNFEAEINVVFYKFSQPEKIPKFTAVHNWCSRLAIQTELRGQKLQPGSLAIFM